MKLEKRYTLHELAYQTKMTRKEVLKALGAYSHAEVIWDTYYSGNIPFMYYDKVEELLKKEGGDEHRKTS